MAYGIDRHMAYGTARHPWVSCHINWVILNNNVVKRVPASITIMVAWNKFHQISGFIFTLGQRNSLCKKVKKVGSGISTWDWISANGWMCESGRWKYLLRSPSWSACWCTFSLFLQSPLNVKLFLVHQIMVIVRSVHTSYLSFLDAEASPALVL